jgi:hypothetical protein
LVDTFVRNNLYIDFIFKFNQLTALYYYKAKQKFPERQIQISKLCQGDLITNLRRDSLI